MLGIDDNFLYVKCSANAMMSPLLNLTCLSVQRGSQTSNSRSWHQKIESNSQPCPAQGELTIRSVGGPATQSLLNCDVMAQYGRWTTIDTECPKIYRKSVLYLLKYAANLYYTDAVQICGKFWDTQYIH